MAIPLKRYQKDVLEDFIDYCQIYRQCENGIDPPRTAFRTYWKNRGINKDHKKWEEYHGNSNYPRVCLKVPTGGGKTLIALASIKRFFDTIPRSPQFVVWLVPSDPIKEQTYSNLTNPEHPYRQQLNADYSGNVEVFTSEEIQRRESIRISSLKTHLTILIMNYQAIRTENPLDRKLFKYNPNMEEFGVDLTGRVPASFDRKSVMAGVHYLSPYVVLDEGHNAISDLSIEMLNNLNPACVLELTATPIEDTSNVLSFVDARTLKDENMIKIPLFLWGRVNVRDVIDKSIRMRKVLEEMAKDEEQVSGRYIRPIVLFQAPPNLQSSNMNYEKLVEILTAPEPDGYNISKDELAIRVGDGKGLHTVDGVKYETSDLMKRDCPIRFIVTVNALKEGWDCPFAYILASLASRGKDVEVEQIVGRILRQPYAERCTSHPQLNESFVITCSEKFYDTVTRVTDILKKEGFSKDDYRIHKEGKPFDWSQYGGSTGQDDNPPEDENAGDGDSGEPEDPFAGITPNGGQAGETASSTDTSGKSDGLPTSETGASTDTPSEATPHEGGSSSSDDEVKRYLDGAGEDEGKGSEEGGPITKKKPTDSYTKVRPEFEDDIKQLVVPLFNIAGKQRKLDGTNRMKLDKDYLFDPETFNLGMMPIDIPFGDLNSSIGKMDLHSNSKQMDFKQLDNPEQREFNREFGYTTDRNSSEFKECVNRLMKYLDIRCIDEDQIRDYVERIVKTQNVETLTAIYNNPVTAADRITEYIDGLRKEHYKKRFYDMVDSDAIHCDTEAGGYQFPPKLKIISPDTEIVKSLYEVEETVNDLEIRVRSQILASSNVRWYHRIRENKQGEFFINGFRNHYPDFAVMTNTGYLVFVEAKGGHLDGTDSGEKVDMSTIWDMKAGNKFKYVMVFDTGNNRIQNKITLGALTNYLDNMGRSI